MHPQAIQILETAMALQRAPGERFRLRERPLPEGLVHVLEVASGAPTAVAEAASALAVPEDLVLEASRFYLEQVLFASPEADAYRVLGVAPDASADDIRMHHRWLQRWLHPDRAQAGDAAVFATRVNEAWARLRSPDARRAYDAQRLQAGTAVPAGAGVTPPPQAVRHWQFMEPASSHGRRSRWLFGAALAACTVLAVLIVRHEEAPAAWPEAAVEPVAARADVPATPVQAVSPPALPARPAASAPPPPSEARLAAVASAPRLPAPATARPAVPAKPAAAARLAEKPRRTDTPRVLVASATPPAARQVALPAAPTAAPMAAPAAVPSAIRPAAPPVREPAPVTVAVAAPAVPQVQAPDPDAAMLLERMRKAEQRVVQLAAYLAAQPDAAPLWNDVQTQTAADRARDRIAGRQGARLELAEPNWQLQPDNATFSAAYRCGNCRVRRGRLDVKLVWRAGLWLVRGVEVAPSA